ncbi:MAG: sulfite exporter TauE/SafE family protein [Pseudomonadota bacterium]
MLGPLSADIFALLTFVSFLTSAMTAAFGIGGGVALMAVMAQVMPPFALIPVHAVVQMGSNISRLILLFRDVNWWATGWFAVGGLAGALTGVNTVVTLDAAILQLILGVFILVSFAVPSRITAKAGAPLVVLGAVLSTFTSFFIGASGPLTSVVVKSLGIERHAHVATFSAAMSLQHGAKIIAFGWLGFAFAEYAIAMVAMISAGFLGTLAGRFLLNKMSETYFRWGLNGCLALLALRLIYIGITGLNADPA